MKDSLVSRSATTAAQDNAKRHAPTAAAAYVFLPDSAESILPSAEISPADRIFNLELWKRALLTCDRAGYREIVLAAPNPPAAKRWAKLVIPTMRCRASVKVIARADLGLQDLPHRAVLMDWNVVLQPGLLARLKEQVERGGGSVWSLLGNDGRPLGLTFAGGERIRRFLLGESATVSEWSAEELSHGTIEGLQAEPGEFFGAVTRRADLDRAEAGLLRGTRSRQRYFMDRHFNSALSTRISRWLAKTGIIPNQITLLGLPMALACFWLFCQGDYWAGVAGAVLFVFTAIWDCCDGEIARLKFQETEMGDILDLLVDNAINLACFLGLGWGFARHSGWTTAAALIIALVAGGTLIFLAVYVPRSAGKAGRFQGTLLDPLTHLLVNRDFVYVVLLFCLLGRADLFLWLAAIGAMVFGLALTTGRVWLALRQPSDSRIFEVAKSS